MADKRDQGYAWVTLAASFFLQVIFSASYSALGVLTLEFLSHFETSKTAVTWIGALNMFVSYMTAIFGGILLKKFGSRIVVAGSALLLCVSCAISGFFPYIQVLYTFYGVLAGNGFLYFHVAGMVTVQQWFDKKRALASGISMAGLSVGVLVWPPLTRWLIDLYCWQGALIVLGALYLNGLISAVLLRPPPKVKTEGVKVTNDSSHDDKLVREPPCKKVCSTLREFWPFVLFLVATPLGQVGHMNYIVYTPVRAAALDIDNNKIPLLVSVMGLTGIICRPIAGWMGDRRRINGTVMTGVSHALVGVAGLISTKFKSFSSLMVMSAAVGIISACYTGILGAVVVDIAGLAHIEIATSLCMVALGVGNIMLHTITGAILDLTGNPDILFWVFGSTQIVGGILITIIPFVRPSSTEIKPNHINDKELKTFKDFHEVDETANDINKKSIA